MDAFVFAAVLFAALCHAGWNALLKLKLEPLLAITLVSIGCGLVVVPFVPFAPLPEIAAWPFIAGSLALHMVYYTALGEAYRAGDLGQVYPIARGTAPLLTAGGAYLVVGESLGALGWSGIVVLAAGVVVLSFKGGRDVARFETRAVGFALLTALSIGAYTVVDGMGVRRAGEPAAYIVWLFLLDGLMMLVFGIWRWGGSIAGSFREAWLALLLGAAMSTAAYAIAIWAMSRAPIALVAALRETSVLFAALIGVLVLREPLLPLRVLAGLLVLSGIVLLRLR
jgi:drug/metabolite transporter (DMT)-like permease